MINNFIEKIRIIDWKKIHISIYLVQYVIVITFGL
jgi:hypothetical protein